MNDAAPLDPDQLDELLSADLDGELAAAAREQGSDVETLRARIAVTPGAAARRTALATAREVLAQPPEFDELVAARLRAKAVRAAVADGDARDTARRDRRNRVLVTVSGIAASIVVVTAIAVAVGRSGSSSSSKNAADAPATSGPQIDVTRPVPALGAYTDVGALGSVALNAARRRAADVPVASGSGSVPGPLAAEKSPTKAAAPADGPGTSSGSLQYGSNDRSVASSAAPAKRATRRLPACSAAKFAGPGEQLSMRASATLNGRPVQVYVFGGRNESTVVVLGAACELVNVQTLG
jgi:hypothetical protein